MAGIKLWSYVRGYVIIKVEGLSLERFINLSVNKNIYIWDIQRISHTTLTARIRVGDFKKLHEVMRRYRFRVKILDKVGFPFVLHRMKRRKMLTLGVSIFIFLLIFLSSFIWDLQIQGLNTIDEDIVINELEIMGVKPGILKRNVDTHKLETNLMLRMPEISWIGVEIRGTRVFVEIVEKLEQPDMIDSSIPCNVIARRDGIISRMVVLQGKPIVEVGDTVKKGQVLITGKVDIDEENIIYVHAMGEVVARTWYEGYGELPLEGIIKERTGNVKIKKYIRIGGIRVKLRDEDIDFKSFIKETEVDNLVGAIGPFEGGQIVTERYYETTERKINRGIEETRNIAKEMAIEDALKKIPKNAKVVDKTFKFSIIEDRVIAVRAAIETLEDIGTKHKMTIGEESDIEQHDGSQNNN